MTHGCSGGDCEGPGWCGGGGCGGGGRGGGGGGGCGRRPTAARTAAVAVVVRLGRGHGSGAQEAAVAEAGREPWPV